MRFLGIDYGTKRIGVAISDAEGKIAFPKEIMKNNGELFKKLESIVAKDEISGVIVGESFDFAGLPNVLMKEIEFFVSKSEKKFKIPVYLEKEFLTSVEARRYNSPEKHVDASAAALILQRYLDKKNQQKQ